MTSSTPETRTIPFGRPWLDDSDRQAVADVLEGSILTHGPRCKEFEASFVSFMGGGHAVTVSSCMASLHLAALHFSLGPGDEVIIPAQTHSATAHAVEWVGATPVFVDCDRLTGNVTPELVRAAVTPRTRAIFVVHFLGIPCDMPGIVAVAEEHGLKVIEDCALAIGSRWEGTHVGLFGDAGCFSFYPVKHITSAEGGMFVSRHEDVVAKVERLRAFGVDRTHTERAIPGMYDVKSLGLNYRMSELQAALGASQLARIDEILDRRRRNFAIVNDALAALGDDVHVIDSTDPRAKSTHYCLSVVLHGDLAARRTELIFRLNDAGVGTSIHYPQPVPRMTYYREKYGYDESAFPNATEISDGSIALPVGPHLDEDDARYVGETVVRVLQERA